MRDPHRWIPISAGKLHFLAALLLLLSGALSAMPQKAPAQRTRAQEAVMPPLDRPAPVQVLGGSVSEVARPRFPTPLDEIARHPAAPRSAPLGVAVTLDAPTITSFTATPDLPQPWGENPADSVPAGSRVLLADRFRNVRRENPSNV